MKKFLTILALIILLSVSCLLITGCGKKDTYEIALVTDVGNIDDKSFNQGTWEGVVEYAKANKVTYNYYRPSEDSTEARVETMKTAIDKLALKFHDDSDIEEDDIVAEKLKEIEKRIKDSKATEETNEGSDQQQKKWKHK